MSEVLHNQVPVSRNSGSVCICFDGVIYPEINGEILLHQKPNPGALEFIEGVIKFFDVHVYSHRSSTPGGIDCMKNWLLFHYGRTAANKSLSMYIVSNVIKWPVNMPKVDIVVDAHTIPYNGVWPSITVLQGFCGDSKPTEKNHTYIEEILDCIRPLFPEQMQISECELLERTFLRVLRETMAKNGILM